MEEEEHLPVPATVELLRRFSRSDWIGLSMGAIAFFVGFFVYPEFGPSIPRALPASIFLVLMSFLVGLVSGFRARSHKMPEPFVGPLAIRWGARTGLISYLAGAGSMALGLHARYLFSGSGANGPFSASGLCLSTLLVLLPTVVAGAIGTYLGVTWDHPSSASLPPKSPKRPSQPIARAAMVAASSSFILGALPYHLPSRSTDRAPEPVSDFGYEPPKALATASAGRWRVVASRSIPGLSQRSIAAPSPDGRLMAYADKNGAGISVFDLRKGREEQRFVTQEVGGLAWSPAGDRLFYVCGLDSTCWVLALSTGRAIRLPVRGPPPFGSPQWRSEKEVLFGQGSVHYGMLDLDTLTTRASRLAGDSEPGPVPASSIVETENCRVTVRKRVLSFVSPLEAGAGYWQFEAGASLCVEEKGDRHAFQLLDGDVPPGATFVASPDASTITVLTAGGAVTHYMGLADERPRETLAVALPKLPDLADGAPLSSMTRSGRIGAFICAPLVNPLNQKVIGPDPRQVKALGFCSGWDAGGRIAVAERYAPSSSGDVAGYLHYWDDGQTTLLSGSGLEQWWSPAEVSSAPGTSAPDAPLTWLRADLLSSPSGTLFRGWLPSEGGDPLPAVTHIDALSVPPPKPQIAITSSLKRTADDTRKPAAEEPVKQDGPQSAVRSFVARHHAKVGAGDLDGFVADYAGMVDFNDKGIVDADFIRKDQAAYLPKYDRLSETVVGDIDLLPIKEGWRASYTVRSFAVSRRDGKEHDRNVRITLEIGYYRGGVFQILKERAASEN